MEQAIQVENLCFGYGRTTVLDRVSFSVAQGDFVGVIGSNGAGKSTLLGLLLGELRPTGGTIRLMGENIRHFRNWRSVGYVPQNGAGAASGFPATVREVVQATLPREGFFNRSRREQIDRVLDAVGMLPFARRRIGALSGGQLQRVLIARALAGGVRLLLLDEPASSIDPQAAQDLYALLEELGRQGMTIVMVTHDIARSAQVVGRTLCLEHGSIVELDRAQMEWELCHRHRHPPAEHGKEGGYAGV